ncbi:uncharacterized protein LOC113337403 [Papaver somniferum]|uniref:uncharacterized protein LOC113337403 n=1 Tax=Papaver somniferum TaxID=3469 RepID=UPI000E7023D9|nr:uncharacterized protein LOC113337403 [Papaver somniferum]
MVIKHFKNNKSPGPYGYNMEFYKVAWEMIKEDVMAVIKEFEKEQKLDWRTNVSFISLIPKKEQVGTPQDFRPISLISHPQYADDTLVFLNANEDEAENLVMILQIFEAITGLKVNFNKSSVISIGADAKIEAIAVILNCKIEKLPLKYLGMSVGAQTRNAAIWDVVIEKFQKKLAPWKRKFFTKAGRLLLIKTTLSSLPIYYMSIFQMPVMVEQKLNQIIRRFPWGATTERKRINWVAWERACRPKNLGGLVIRNLKLTNKALMDKWSWRFAKEKKQLWRRIIQEKMQTQSKALWVKDSNKSQGRGMWKNIQKQKQIVEQLPITQINKGDTIMFWWDCWTGTQSLKLQYPNIYNLSTSKNGTVKDMIHNNAWNLKLRRNLTQQEIPEMLALFAFLGTPPTLNDEEEDDLVCTATGGFNAKICYNWMMEQIPSTHPTVPHHVSGFKQCLQKYSSLSGQQLRIQFLQLITCYKHGNIGEEGTEVANSGH